MFTVNNAAVAGLLLGLTISTGSAGVIVENLAGTLGPVTEYYGQSFTTPSGGPFDDLTFSFFSDVPAATPSAAGTAYLLSEPYSGTPAGLSTTTPGFLAASTGVSSGVYIFGATVTIQSGVTYYLYEDTALPATGGNAITGGNAYFANASTTAFATALTPDSTALQSANFELSGSAVPLTSTVPEPAPLVLVAAGIGACLTRKKVTP
jgi:hypothetical protein